jgi:hypothetical protein
MEEGRDGGVRTEMKHEAQPGADADSLSALHRSGHTTTQPSSIEEEGNNS